MLIKERICPARAIRGWLSSGGLSYFLSAREINQAYSLHPLPASPLHSELWLMSAGMMFILGSKPWEEGKRPGVGTAWSSFFSPFSAQALVILEENIETSCPPASRET